MPSPAEVTKPTLSTADNPSERIRALDVLRGFAVLGMILVHVHFYANDFHDGPGNARTALEEAISWAIWVLVETKSHATFAFLFGVGFAIQLRRAESRGTPFLLGYLRRLVVLGLFGFATHAFFGYNVLLSYAYGGLWLLLVRRWSPRAILVAAVLSAMLPSLYSAGRRAYDGAMLGRDRAIAAAEARVDTARVHAQSAASALTAAENQTNYAITVRARLGHMRWFYTQRFFILPGSTLCLFLLGMLALRCGILGEPRRRARLIASVMAVGAAAWASVWWLRPAWEGAFAGPWLLDEVQWGLGVVNEQWLAFTYVGVVLLLVAFREVWLERLAPFGWVGRMALTNYLLQIALLEVLFARHGLDLRIREAMVLPAALLLFGGEIALSRIWLARFRCGPAEWLWRSLTDGRLQPLALPRPTPQAIGPDKPISSDVRTPGQ